MELARCSRYFATATADYLFPNLLPIELYRNRTKLRLHTLAANMIRLVNDHAPE